MAKTSKGRQHTQQKKLAKRNKKRTAKQNSLRSGKPLEPSNKVARKLGECYDLIDQGYFDEAESLLNYLVSRHSRVPAVIETQMMLYQELGDHRHCCSASKRLLELTPRDPDALMMYAQESMFCGRASIALQNYRECIRRLPANHENVAKARIASEICENECRNRVEKSRAAGFHDFDFDDTGLELFAQHESSLEQLQAANFEEAIRLCRLVLKSAPRFLPARNNLASCHFHNGELELAVELARETCALAPENQYAKANLIQLEFLTGNPNEANRLADRLVADPPQEQDSAAAACGALSFLGRDEDVVTVAEIGVQNKELDSETKAIISHYRAVAHFRLGDEKTARRYWNQCLKQMPNHPEANANLDDIESGSGHAAWADPLGKWLPAAVLRNVLSENDQQAESDFRLLDHIPMLETLIPVLLDRGDPEGRKFALNLATMNLTPKIVESLYEFGTSHRGPRSLRHQALLALYQNGDCEAGPHRFFSLGKWTEIQMFCPEITEEPVGIAPAWEQKLLRIASDAMNANELDRAEAIYEQILERDPGSRSSEFNLASVWLRRDGKQGHTRAEKVIQRLHREHPDYVHATIAMAQFASIEGDFEESGRLLGEVTKQQKLHITQATALFATQAQIALARKDFSAAENACEMLAAICGEDDYITAQIRERIELATSRRSLPGLSFLKGIF